MYRSSPDPCAERTQLPAEWAGLPSLAVDCMVCMAAGYKNQPHVKMTGTGSNFTQLLTM